MNREPRNDLEQRDTALARVLAEALKQRQSTATAAAPSGETCPEAELLAAYAERTLDENEIARWENHFVDCRRCRTILAVLTANADQPLAAQEVRDLGELVGTAVLPGARAQKVPRSSSRFPARWSWLVQALVPAIGLAAGLALFFVLRPPRFAPAAPQLAMKQSAVKTMDSPSGTAPTKKADEQPDREIAQAYISAAPLSGTPAAPASRARNIAPDRDSFSGERTENKAKEEASTPTPSPPPPPTAPPAQRELDAAAAASERRALQSEAAPVNGPAAGAAGAGATAPTPRPLASAAQAKSAAPTPPAEQSDGVTSDRNALELRSQTQAALSTSVARAGLFTSPGGKVSWRLSASGRIERSSDGGRNWQLQPSGVTSDLLAGVAASEQAAWVVGRAGVILRTTDGSRWERVSSPSTAGDRSATIAGNLAVTEPDWISVQATDALHATIVSSDAQRFRTDDGGRTWTRQP